MGIGNIKATFPVSDKPRMLFNLLINVGILTFMSRLKSILGLSEPGKVALIFPTYEYFIFHARLS